MVAEPVPQGGRKMRPQSAQRRRPSLTPNLDIIPEFGGKGGSAGASGPAMSSYVSQNLASGGSSFEYWGCEECNGQFMGPKVALGGFI